MNKTTRNYSEPAFEAPQHMTISMQLKPSDKLAFRLDEVTGALTVDASGIFIDIADQLQEINRRMRDQGVSPQVQMAIEMGLDQVISQALMAELISKHLHR
jgi:hypothetical protein